MKNFLVRHWKSALVVLGIGITAAAFAQTVGGSCFSMSCRAQDAATLGGSAYGHASGAGYAGNTGGDCVGDGCNAGNGNTIGGNCYGQGCKAGNAWNSGGDCYGQGCTPGQGGTVGGRANPAPKNTACILGEIYRFPNNTRPTSTVNWNTAQGAACQPVPSFNSQGQRIQIAITPVVAPSPLPTPVAVTPLPANPWDPANLPKCPFSCQMYNPASGTCVGAAMNAC